MASKKEAEDVEEAIRRSLSSYYNHAFSDAVPDDVIAESIALAESAEEARRQEADLNEAIRLSLFFDNTVPNPASAGPAKDSDDEYVDAVPAVPDRASAGPAEDSDDEYVDALDARPPGRGIRNYGNTCYFNAAIQAFSAIPDVIAVLSAIEEASAGAGTSPGCAAYIRRFRDLVVAAAERGEPGAVTDSAAACLESVRSLAALTHTYAFPENRQSDASEVFRYMIEALQECTNPGANWSASKLFEESSEEENLKLAYKRYSDVEFNIANAFTRFFLGCYVETKFAPPGITSTNLIPLSLGDPATGVQVTAGIDVELQDLTSGRLEAALETRFGPNMPGPDQDPRSWTHERIYQLPDVLVIRLTREKPLTDAAGRIVFRDGRMGVEVDLSPMEFPTEGLDMAPYLHPKSPFKWMKHTYTLSAVINRPPGYGVSGAAGHYTAVTRQPGSSQWTTYNDSAVSPFDFSADVQRRLLRDNRSIFNTATVLLYTSDAGGGYA